MGSCGCGDTRADFRFPAPGGDVYVLDIYDSCADCQTPAGIVLYRMTKRQAEFWDAKSAAPLDVTEEGVLVPLVDPAVLARLMGAWAKPVRDEYDADGLCADAVEAVFRDAVAETVETWRKRREP